LISTFHWSVVAAYAAGLIYAAVSDARSLTIPNWLCGGIALAFLPAAWMAGQSGVDMAQHYALGVAFLVAGALIFAAGIMGGGDVKLLAAIAPWLDFELVGRFLILVALIGGGVALCVLAVRRLPFLASVRSGIPWLADDEPGASQAVPYGIAIAMAALWVLPKLTILPVH